MIITLVFGMVLGFEVSSFVYHRLLKRELSRLRLESGQRDVFMLKRLYFGNSPGCPLCFTRNQDALISEIEEGYSK